MRQTSFLQNFKQLLKFVRPILLALVALGGVLSSTSMPAVAASISIVAGASVTVDEPNQELTIKFTLTNEGDELAREVGVEFPELNESVIIGKEVYPKQKAEHERKLKFETVGIKAPGMYAIPFRVLYKDVNFYPFSAAYVTFATVGSAPTRSVDIEAKGKDIAIVTAADVSSAIESITTAALSAIKLEVFTSTEFAVQIKQPIADAKLEIGNSVPFAFNITNRSALPGSEYAVILLVSGMADGKHMAEPFYLRLQVVSAWKFYRNFLIAAVVGVVALGFIGLTLKKKQSS